MTINFQDPRLQRMRQKVAALGPESRAILNTASETSQFAQSEAMKELKLMNIATSLQAKRNALEAQRRNFENTQFARANQVAMEQKTLGLKRGEWKDAKKQGKIATVLGLAGIAPKAYMGYKAYKNSGQTTEDVIKLAREIDAAWGKVPTK